MSDFIKMQQDIIDRELEDMSVKDVDEILSIMTYPEAQIFLEQIGRLRIQLVYELLQEDENSGQSFTERKA